MVGITREEEEEKKSNIEETWKSRAVPCPRDGASTAGPQVGRKIPHHQNTVNHLIF